MTEFTRPASSPPALFSQRRKHRRAKAPSADEAQALVEKARIDKWIRDRVVVDWRDSCWRCGKPIVLGHAWTTIANDGVSTRFHQSCHAEWLAKQEVAARRALGLDRTRMGLCKQGRAT
jgi:hypothetical protein